MNQILDSQGRPVQIVSRAARTSFENRGNTVTAPGTTMLSRFAGNQSGDLAKYRKLASDIQTANPSIRSPLLNQSNFYMPESDSSTGEPNRLLNQWITYYVKFHHAVGSILSLHSELPLSRFALRGISDKTVLQYYEDMAESMSLHEKSVDILKQFFTYGETIPFAFWSDKYNSFTDLTLLDTNYVYVKGHYLLHSEEGDDVEFYELEPDPLLQNLVKSDDYVNQLLAANLDAEFIAAVRQNKRVLLSNFSTHMMKDKLKYSDLRGSSIVLRCFVEGTPIVLANGINKPIQSIEPGELVLTHDNKIKPVKAVFRRLPEPDEEILSADIYGQNLVVCSDQHEFLVWTGAQTCPCGCGIKIKASSLDKPDVSFASGSCGKRWRTHHKEKMSQSPKNFVDETFEWKKLKDIEVGEYLCVRQGAIEGATSSTPADMNADRARLLGYFLAEGSYIRSRNKEKIYTITFMFSSDESEYISDVQNIFKKEFGLDSYLYLHNKGNTATEVRAEQNTFIGDWMYKYAGEYSGSKRMPDNILLWDKEVLLNICKGYFCGDGSWTKGYVTSVSKSFSLTEQIQAILFVLGVPSTTCLVDNRNKQDIFNRADFYKKLFISKTNIKYMPWLDSSLGYDKDNKESEYAPLVQRIIDLTNQGVTKDKICEILTKEEYKTTSGTPWYRSIVSRIIAQGCYGIRGRRSGNKEKIIGKYLVRQLVSKTKIDYQGYLYNLNVEDSHSYLVNDHVIAKNCLKSLLYSDKLKESQYVVADGNINPKWIWKIGQAGDLSSGGYMPTEDDLIAFRDLLVQSNNDPLFTIITHYAVNVDAVGLNGKLLPITQELDHIEDEILTALFCNKAMTTGQGPSFATASIAFRTLMSRYIPVRAKLERYYYQKLFAPTAYANKFYERKQCDLDHNVRTGDEETNKLLIPTIDWRSKSNLLDDGSIKSIISSLVGSGRLPMKMLTEALDLDYTEVRDYLYSEQATVFDPITMEGRKKFAAANTDETMIGQPYAPKTNKPVSLKAARGQGAPAKAAKASKEKPKKFSNLLTIKPLKVTAADDFAVPADPVQTQVNKGKPEVGGNPEMQHPMSPDTLKLDPLKTANSDSTLSDEDRKKLAQKSKEQSESKQKMVQKQFDRHKAKERYRVVEGQKEPLKNDFIKIEDYKPQQNIEVISAADADKAKGK